jgi:hypothetical protein
VISPATITAWGVVAVPILWAIVDSLLRIGALIGR